MEEAAKTKSEALIKGQSSELVDLVDSGIALEELQSDIAKLKQKIETMISSLSLEDPATGEAVRLALRNKFELDLYKCQALLIRLGSKVRQAVLAAVPFKRRISRSKKGNDAGFMISAGVSINNNYLA